MPEVLDLRSPGQQAAPISGLSASLARCPAQSPGLPATLFDRCWREYALFREHLFTDHTRQIASALAPALDAPISGGTGRHLVELGCGPGFYSRRLAARFPHLRITGIDLSAPLLDRAQRQADRSGLTNCSFLRADALSLADSPGQLDAVIASRFFLILAQPTQTLGAIFTALRPGGLCFIAEPTSALRASLPLLLMKMTERLARSPAPLERVPESRVFTGSGFQGLVESQPWASVRIWKDRRYHCAVCRKAA